MTIAPVCRDRSAQLICSTLVERGWTQRQLKDPQGRVCLLGAVEELEPAERPRARLVSAIAAEGSQTAYNDAEGRTLDDVLAALATVEVSEPANLRDADLSGADLSGADLRRADLWSADLSGATWDSTTQWPEGLRCSTSARTVAKPAASCVAQESCVEAVR